MKKTLQIAAFVCFAATAKAQNVGYVRLDSILSSHPTYMQLLKDMDSTRVSYTEEVAKDEKRINERFNPLFAKYDVKEGETIDQVKARMTPDDTLAFSLLMSENQVLQNKIKSYDNMLKFIYSRDISPIEQKVMDSIKSYADKNKYDAIFIREKIAESTVYLSPSKDLTTQIIANLAK